MANYEDLKGRTLGEQNANATSTDQIVDIEKELLDKYHFKTVKDTEEIYYYNSEKGIFVRNGEQIIKREYIEYFPDCKISDVDKVVFHLRFKTLIDREQFDSKIEWLAAKDCMINLKTGESKPHSPDFMATVRIPHNYNIQLKQPLPTRETYVFETLSLSSCPCPNIMRFLYDVMSPEDVEKFLDFAAYCLWRGYPFHKWLYLNGSGRNGKGVTLSILKALLGRYNTSSEALQRILENNFAPARLYGKLANIDADVSKEDLKNTGLLKKITGNDTVSLEEKFKNAFDANIFAKLVFSGNKMPETSDETDAFFSRPIIINYQRQFAVSEQDPYLTQKLTTEREMSGLLNLLVSRLARVLESGISGSDESIEDNYKKYVESSDPIRGFVESAISTSDKDSYASKDAIYNAYRDYCIAKHLNPENEYTFSLRLSTDYKIEQKRLQLKGKPREYYWMGIKLIDWKAIEDEGQTTL